MSRSAKSGEDDTIQVADPMEQAKRIMKRLAETPYKPHQTLGVSPKPKERPASKGRVHKGKTRS